MKHTGRKLLFTLFITLFAAYIAIPSRVGNFQKSVLDKPLLLGLDLVGGSRLTFEADTQNLSDEARARALESLKIVMERRVNLFGVSEANVLTSRFDGKDRIIIELPGVTDTKQAISVVGKTAQLSFMEVEGEEELVETDLTGADLKTALVSYESVGGRPVVSLEFTDEGAIKFSELTEKNKGKVLPIVLDGAVVSAPLVSERIDGGSAQISGNFTLEEAKALSVQLNAGALPIPVQLVEERTIGAALGSDAIEKSLKAGLVGIAAVLLFMILLYGKLGFLADVALIIFAVLTFALYKLIPVVLTLPGITGFILSVGMAVDSNILIFERYKEEKKKGMETPHALEVAFGRAWNSIRDANIATLVTAFVLANPLDWQFLNTSGPVRGFAFTLALGIAISLFTGIFVSRNLLRFFIRK